MKTNTVSQGSTMITYSVESLAMPGRFLKRVYLRNRRSHFHCCFSIPSSTFFWGLFYSAFCRRLFKYTVAIAGRYLMLHPPTERRRAPNKMLRINGLCINRSLQGREKLNNFAFDLAGLSINQT